MKKREMALQVATGVFVPMAIMFTIVALPFVV